MNWQVLAAWATPAMVAVGALMGWFLRLHRSHDDHETRLSHLEAGQKTQDSQIGELRTLITGTRELMIERFARLFERLGIHD